MLQAKVSTPGEEAHAAQDAAVAYKALVVTWVSHLGHLLHSVVHKHRQEGFLVQPPGNPDDTFCVGKRCSCGQQSSAGPPLVSYRFCSDAA